jgi:hypothetical protein
MLRVATLEFAGAVEFMVHDNGSDIAEDSQGQAVPAVPHYKARLERAPASVVHRLPHRDAAARRQH